MKTDQQKADFSDLINGLAADMSNVSETQGNKASAAWLESHTEHLRRFDELYGRNHVRMTENGPQPSEIPVPRGPGICNPDVWAEIEASKAAAG